MMTQPIHSFSIHTNNPLRGGQLFGMYAQPNLQLYTINPETAHPSPIGTFAASNESIAQQLSDIDPVRGIYYVLTMNLTSSGVQLIGLSVESGKIVRNVILPLVETIWIGAGQSVTVDPKTGNVLISGQTAPNSPVVILKVSPDNSVTKLYEFSPDLVVGSISGFDPKYNILYLEYIRNKTHLELHAFDGTSGRPLGIIENTVIMQTMAFDAKRQLMVGIGLEQVSETKFQRTLVSLNSKTFTLQKEHDIEGDFIIMDAIMGPIDYVNRKLYCMMSPEQSQPFTFLTIDLDSGVILNKVTSPKLPWSIEVLNLP